MGSEGEPSGDSLSEGCDSSRQLNFSPETVRSTYVGELEFSRKTLLYCGYFKWENCLSSPSFFLPRLIVDQVVYAYVHDWKFSIPLIVTLPVNCRYSCWFAYKSFVVVSHMCFLPAVLNGKGKSFWSLEFPFFFPHEYSSLSAFHIKRNTLFPFSFFSFLLFFLFLLSFSRPLSRTSRPFSRARLKSQGAVKIPFSN